MNILPWIIWILSSIFIIFKSIQLPFFDVAAAKIATSLSADEEILSSISAIYFYTYATLQIPVGLIFDRFNAKKPLIFAITCSAIGACLFSIADDPVHAIIYRIIMGTGSAFGFIGSLKLIQEWFPPEKFSTLAGITGTATTLGGVFGLPLDWAINAIGWREVMMVIGLMQFLLLALFYIFTREPKQPIPKNTEIEDSPKDKKTIGGIFGMLRNKQCLLNISFGTAMCVIYGGFGGLWGANYIMQYYKIEDVHAASIGSYLFIGSTIGPIFFGWLSSRIQNNKNIMLFAGIASAISLSSIVYIENLPIIVFEFILSLIGIFSGVYIISYTYAKNLYPRLSSLSIGLLNTVVYLGIGGSQQIVGFLLQFHSNQASLENVSQLSLADYRFAFSSMVFFIIIGIISTLFLKKTNPVI